MTVDATVPENIFRRRGRPTADAAQARTDELLRVAGELFERNGFEGVSMGAVARAAQVSKTTLYARYPDKVALFRAIGSYACRLPAGRIAAVATQDRDPSAVLEDFAWAVVETTGRGEADHFLRLAIFEARRFPDLAAQILTESRAVIAPLEDYLAQLGRDGIIDCTDPARLSDQFVALLTGGPVALLAPALDAGPDAATLRSSLDLFLAGIGLIAPHRAKRLRIPATT